MVEVKSYKLPPTALIPNSPFPLLHYRGVYTPEEFKPAEIYDRYKNNGWQTQWIFRYGPTQVSHYHSQSHECMTVLTGTATIRFGVADTSDDLEESTHGPGKEDGGVEVEAKAGDVFIIPAGVSHKTYDTTPAPFALLTPGRAQGIEAGDPKKVLSEIELSGFCMMGAYPQGSQWDFAIGAKDDGHFERVWSVPKPERDPVLGGGDQGLVGLWQGSLVKGGNLKGRELRVPNSKPPSDILPEPTKERTAKL